VAANLPAEDSNWSASRVMSATTGSD